MASRSLDVPIKTKGAKKAKDDIKSTTKAIKENVKAQNTMKRAQEGVAKGSLSTAKAFSKQQQGLGGLVRAYATVAAHVFALTQVFQILRDAADFYSMQKAAEDMSKVTGVNMMRLAKEVQAATGHNLALRDSLESVNKTLAAGATPTQAKELALLAAKISQTFGGSVEANINKINSAVLRGRTELLATLGVVIDTQQVYRDYAAQLGKTSGELTSFEKKQATLNAIQEEGNKILGDVNLDRNPYLALLTTLTDVKDEITLFVNSILTGFVEIINESKRFGAALIGTLGAIFARKLTPDAASYASSAKEALKSVRIALIRQSRTEIGLAIKAGDLQRARAKTAIVQSRKSLVSRLKDLKDSERANKKFAATTQSLFKKVEREGIMAFKNISASTKKELAVLQAQITKTIKYQEKLASGATVKPLRGVSSGIAKGDLKALKATRDLIDEQLDPTRKLNREVKKLEVSKRSLGLTLRNLNAQRKVAIATTTRMAASQKILTLRLVEQRGVIAAIIPSFIAVERRLRRIVTATGAAGFAFRLMGRAAGYAATATTLLASAVNKVFPVLMGLWLAWELGLAVYKKFFGASEEQNEQLEKAREAYKEYTEVLQEAEKSLSDLSDLAEKVRIGEKTQSSLNAFLVNLSDTLITGLSSILNPIINPTISLTLDTKAAEDKLDMLKKKLDSLENRKSEVRRETVREDFGETVEGALPIGTRIDREGLRSQLDEVKAQVEETANELKLINIEFKVKTKIEEIASTNVELQGVLATLQTIFRLQRGAELVKLDFDISPVLDQLRLVNSEWVDIILKGREAGADWATIEKQLESTEFAIKNPEGLREALKLIKEFQAKTQSISGSMAIINEQFVRSYGAAAKFREEVTNMTMNPELTRANQVIVEQLESFKAFAEEGVDRGSIADFLGTDLLKKDSEELYAIFGKTKKQLSEIINSENNTVTLTSKLIKLLQEQQSILFSTAKARVFETQGKAAEQLGKSYQDLAKTALTIEDRFDSLNKAQDNLIRGAELQVKAAEQLVIEKQGFLDRVEGAGKEAEALAAAELEAAKAARIAALAKLEETRQLQLQLRAEFQYEEEKLKLYEKQLSLQQDISKVIGSRTIDLRTVASANANVLAKQKQIYDVQLQQIELEKKRVRQIFGENILGDEKVANLELEADLIKAKTDDLYLQVALEQQILDIRSRGNRYNPLPGDIKQFGRDLHTLLQIEAYNFAKGMKTAAEEWAKVILDTTDSLVDNLVDDAIEGGVNVMEAVKASIRSSISELVKENIKGSLRNIIAGIFPKGKAAKAKTQEEALRKLEETFKKQGEERIKTAREAIAKQVKAGEISEEKAAEQLDALEAQNELLGNAEGRDLQKTENIRVSTTTLTDIFKYLTGDQKDYLQALVACCQCACSNKGTQDFGPSLLDFTNSDVFKPNIPTSQEEPSNGPTAADRAPPREDVSIIIPPRMPGGNNNGPTEADRGRTPLPNDERLATRIEETGRAQIEEARAGNEILKEIAANTGSENVKKHNQTYNEAMDPNREPNEDKGFWLAFNSILKTFFGPFGWIASLFGGGGGGFDFSSIFNMFGGGMANGGIVHGGIRSLAEGGIVNKAQYVQIGEGSTAEAVVPLPNNREIPVKLEGETKSFVFNQTFDFRNADPATETRLRQQAEEIKRATINAVANELNRGGSFSKRAGRR